MSEKVLHQNRTLWKHLLCQGITIAMLLKLGRDVALYEIYQHAWLQSPASSKLNITICNSTRQNTWSHLRCMPVPPSLGLLFSIFNCIFCPVQLQMVVLNFKEEETGTEHVAIATSKCVPCGIFCRVQYPSQVSIVLLHYWGGYS